MNNIKLLVYLSLIFSSSFAQQQNEKFENNIEGFPNDTVWYNESNHLKDRIVVKGIFFTADGFWSMNALPSATDGRRFTQIIDCIKQSCRAEMPVASFLYATLCDLLNGVEITEEKASFISFRI